MMNQGTLGALAMAAFTVFATGCDGGHAEDTTTEAPAADDTSAVDPLTTDDDLDGLSESDGDCNDRNETVYPGARERSFDGVDADCDGEDMPAAGDDRYADALALRDADSDGAVSFEEFDAACSTSAMVFGDAHPGVVQTHSDCGGTNSCRGMVLHPWNALHEHDCRGVNGCAGWSCVEAAAGADRDGATAFTDASCDFCHGSGDTFLVQVPAGEDIPSWVDTFFARSDTQFRSAIAFGLSGVDGAGVAYTNMPGHYETLSRAEMDAVIAYIRTLPLEAPPAE